MNIILFLIQTIFYDALILSSVSVVLKKRIPISQFGLAISASLVASLIIFLVAPIFIFLIPLLTIRIAFSPQTAKQYGLAAIYFYMMSAFLSGIQHTLRYFVNFDFMSIGWFLVVAVVIGIGVAMVFMFKSQFLQKVYTLGEFEHQVTLYYGDESATGIGFVDTGNTLVDRVTQLPVMIACAPKVENLHHLIETGKIPSWELPFSVVGADDQRMIAFRPTLLLIDDVIVKDVVVGLSPTSFAKYDFLLQPEIVGGVV